jgi:uncharacterized repeat protein (TIGR03803 family)
MATLITLASFNLPNAARPAGQLIIDASGNLFGTTTDGGANSAGIVFEIAKTSGGYATTPTTLVSLPGALALGPTVGVVADAAGDLFGTTPHGGTNGLGTVFEVPKTGSGFASTPTILASFNPTNESGSIPESSLFVDAAGDLFGTTSVGGAFVAGTMFEIPKTASGYGTVTTLVTFKPTTIQNPNSGLIADAAGDLFGTTSRGGVDSGGAVFEVPKTGSGYASTPTTLATFDGIAPPPNLVMDAAGDLFGTTQGGGANTFGTVFEIQKSANGYGALTTLINFNGTDGIGPNGSLIVDAAGDLFGTTRAGGAGLFGTVFEIAKAGGTYATTPTILASFNILNGQTPFGGLTADAVGDLFGTTSEGAIWGTVFELTNTGFQVAAAGVLGNLSINQQLELIYIAYFNCSADGGGFTFWSGQNTQAQSGGQTAAVALTNIANSFAPQPETVAIYSFLAPLVSGGTINLNTPAAQAGLIAFIGSVYQNLFNRAADSAGQNYWVGQITSGAVGLGAAALAIANGATGADATEVQNKVAVALDFTSRTNTANLGTTAPLASSFVTAARSVLSGVDGASLNDASVSAGMSATTSFISGSGTGHATTAAANAESPVVISASNAVIDPGAGGRTISFIAGTSGDSLVLHASGADLVSGFDPATDVMDLRSLLREANVDLTGGIAVLGNYVTVLDQGTDALVRFDPSGHGGGNTVAVLQGLGGSVTSLGTLVEHGAIRIA